MSNTTSSDKIQVRCLNKKCGAIGYVPRVPDPDYPDRFIKLPPCPKCGKYDLSTAVRPPTPIRLKWKVTPLPGTLGFGGIEDLDKDSDLIDGKGINYTGMGGKKPPLEERDDFAGLI